MQCQLSAERSPTSLAFSDDALLLSVKSGRSRAFCDIYRRYRRLVYSLALRILKCREDAEDITQEIFLRLYHQRRYDAQRGSLKNFLAMSARSRAIDKLRSRQAYYGLSQTLQTVADSRAVQTPLEQATRQQTISQVRRALACLPLRERQVLESSYYGNLSQSEIATQFDIPLGTVKSRSRQGLQKMRRALTKERIPA
ncbi:MAG: sigma-70 family RNA polymerase sigma factor [Cyanobacteria bacterium J06560_2]